MRHRPRSLTSLILALAVLAGCGSIPGADLLEFSEEIEIHTGVVDYHAGSLSFEAPPAGYRLLSETTGMRFYLMLDGDLRSATFEALVGQRIRVAGRLEERFYGESRRYKTWVMEVVELYDTPGETAATPGPTFFSDS
jgi:hypothetical protein